VTLQIPVYEFGGSGPTLHLSVANGFPPQTYLPLLEPLLGRFNAVSVLPRALWPDPPAPESVKNWEHMSDDLLEGLKAHNLTDVIGIGHSMGGVASVFAALKEPSRFRALILLDPTFLPPHVANMIHFLRIIGQGRRFPLAQGALRRRSVFGNIDEAYDHWKARRLFRNWPERTLRLYAESMTRPRPDGDGVELAWSPRWESQYYQTVHLHWTREVKKLRGLLPTLAIQGARTDTFTNASAKIFRRLFPEAAARRVEGHAHLFPHTAPDETRAIIEEWLALLPVKRWG